MKTMKHLFLSFSLLLLGATTANAALITFDMDGADLNSNGNGYFVAPAEWSGDLEVGPLNTGQLQVNVNPLISGYESATNNFNLTFFLGDLDGIATSSFVAGQGNNSTDIAGADFSFGIGHTSGSWDWVDTDLVAQLEYDLGDGMNYGSYAFTFTDYFDTSYNAPVGNGGGNPVSVPEPGTLALMGMGMIGMIGAGFRKKKHTAESLAA